MRKLPARSRADLLASLATGGLNPATAALLGFVRERVDASVDEETPTKKIEIPPGPGPEPPVLEETFLEPKPGQRLLRFLVPTETETWLDGTEVTKVSPGRPITDQELSVPWDCPGPPLSPLARWARLAPYLRGRLGAWVPGAQLDEPRLMRQMARGLPLLSLPRRRRRAWAAQAVILWDRTQEMHPFQEDARWLLRRLRRERGSHGLAVVRVEGMPGPALLAGIPQDTPVVALSAMGQYQGAEATVQAWLGLGRHLTFAGLSLHALVPCPRRRWRSDLAELWSPAVWDRQPRLPRRGGLRALPGAASKEPPLAQHLLDLLSPSTRIESPLLRDARLSLGPAADAGTEWDAWFDPGGWQSLDCFGYLPGETYEARLARRRNLAETDPEQVRAIDRLIERHHESCSPVIAAEASLRACFAGTPDAATLEKVQDILGRVVDRMREMAKQPGSATGRRSGLASWFENMVERLTPDIRSDASVREAIAQGLALAKVFLEAPHIVWPAGVDVELAKAEMQRAGQRLEAPLNCRLVLRGTELFVEPGGVSVVGIPLARFSAGRRPVHFTQAPSGSGPGRVTTVQLAGTAEPLRVGSVLSPVGWRIQSDRQRIDLVPMTRPAWARRMAYDRYGIWAEFEVGGVTFVLRWIPPGHFRMGSPEGEPGRYPNEGPQHDVTISRGFWLGETPVTQAQWKAVVMEARKDRPGDGRVREIRGLSPTPSHFKGPLDLPVESISWDDAREFCQQMNGLLLPGFEGGFQFSLPTEAQWEYACRAGTETALYTGGITILGKNHAPELDAIAWYGGNSGQDLKVTNPYDSAKAPEKQFNDSLAGPHSVKGKQGNAWGLYDMIGNVWEWCKDGRREYEGNAHSNPRGLFSTTAPSALRGGSWAYRAEGCRAAYRAQWEPNNRGINLGLRLAAGQEPGSAEPRARSASASPKQSGGEAGGL